MGRSAHLHLPLPSAPSGLGRFRTFALLAVLAAAVVSAQAGPASASSKAVASATTVRAAINAVRGQHGLRLLRPSWRLSRAAGQHSQRIGISVVRTSIAPGIFEGLGVMIVTADFGAR